MSRAKRGTCPASTVGRRWTYRWDSATRCSACSWWRAVSPTRFPITISRSSRPLRPRRASPLTVSGGELAIYDERRQELEIVASLNIGVDSTGARLSLGEGAMGHVAVTREPVRIDEYQRWLGRSGKYSGVEVHSVMAAPLLIGHRLVGAFACVHDDPA